MARQLVVDDDLYAYIASRTIRIGEDESSILRRLLNYPAPSDQSRPGGTDPRFGGTPVPEAGPAMFDSFLGEVLASPQFEAGNVTDRFLLVLRKVCEREPERFDAVLSLKGRDRLYFARSADEIERSGRRTNPKKIPGCHYWVMCNSNNDQKKTMLQKVLRLLGFSPATALEAAETLTRP